MPARGPRKRLGAKHYAELFADYLVERRDSDDGAARWVAYCPAHEIPGVSRPSAEICFDDGRGGMMWYCHVCAPEGAECHLDVLAQRMRDRDEADVVDIRTGKKIDAAAAVARSEPKDVVPLEPIDLEPFSIRLITDDDLLADLLARRGITEATVAQFDLGYVNRRNGKTYNAWVIPVCDAEGETINARYSFRNPDPKRGKIAWMRKGGDHPLLCGELLTEDVDTVVVVEGEWDCLLARQLGFHAVTGTRGAKKWTTVDTTALGNRHIVILMDNDDDGEDGARRIFNSIKRARLAKSVKIVHHEVKGADFSDMVLKHGWDKADFDALIKSVAPTPMEALSSLTTSGRPIPFRQLDSRNSANEVVESTVMVNARVGLSKLPWRGSLHCGGDQGKKCEGCPMQANDQRMELDLDREDRDQFLPMIGVSDLHVHRHIKRVFDLNCERFEVDRAKDIDVEHLFVTAPVIEEDDGDDRSTGKIITVFMVGAHDTEAGDIIRIVGRCESDPKKQDSVFMAWHKSNDDPLRERRVLEPPDVERLSVFQPADETPMEKALEVVKSLNTQYGILNRDELGLAYLLVFASVLDFNFKGRREHGWLQAMVLGDTRTGKTALADRYLGHIGLGNMIKCDVTTRAGLVGGQGTHNGNSFLKMGLLPRSDARLAFLDETTNILSNGEIMKHLTDMRSSGKMSINLIDSGQFRARVRQVWITNPPRDAVVDDFPHGAIQAINELIGSPQDLSRFDFLYAVRADRETATAINTAAPKRKRSPYTSDLCRTLMEWIWTRKPDDIVIPEPVERAIGASAEIIGQKYENDHYRVIPGTDAGNKIARIAIAFATLTFSTDNGVRVVVTTDHVDAAEEFLQMMFDDKTLGLGDYCKREAIEVAEAVEHVEWLKRRVAKHTDYQAAIKWLANQTGKFRMASLHQGIELGGGLNPGPVVGALVENGLLRPSGDSLSMSKALRDYLRTSIADGSLRKPRASTRSTGKTA